MEMINALGIDCPGPVIMAKKAFDMEETKVIKILVDNEVATKNLTKLAESLGAKIEVEKIKEKEYSVTISKDDKEDDSSIDIASSSNAKNEDKKENDEYVLILSSNKMGHGEEDFSKKLLEGFIYALTEQDKLPKYILLYNLGVELVSKNQKTIEDLLTLEDKGVEILSCGLCLNQYNLKDSLKVGEITNMYRICEIMSKYRNVSPC